MSEVFCNKALEADYVSLFLHHPEAFLKILKENKQSFDTSLIYTDLYKEILKTAYEVSERCNFQGAVDIIVLAQELKIKGALVDDSLYISTLAELDENNQYSIHNLPSILNFLKNDKARRQLVYVKECLEERAIKALEEPQEVLKELIESLENKFIDNSKDYSIATDEILTYMQNVKDNNLPVRIPTGLTQLDFLIGGGLVDSSLNIIGARPGVGKSALASSIVINILKAQKDNQNFKPCIMFSIEMNNQQIIQRMLASASNCSVDVLNQYLSVRDKLLDEDEINKMHDMQLDAYSNMFSFINSTAFKTKDEEGQEIAFPRLLLNDMSSLTINDIKRILGVVNRRFGGVGCVVVDYLQLMTVDSKIQRSTAFGEISRSLKELARNYKAPVIALCQLNREIEKRRDPELKSSDIKDSGAIEQDADLIMMIHRDFRDVENKAKIYVTKNRNGQTGEVLTHFAPASFKFEDYQG